MKNYRPYILGACWLLLSSLSAVAQTPSTQPGEAHPAGTPAPSAQTGTPTPAKQDTAELQVELGASYEHLSSGFPDWQSYFIRVNRKFTSGQTLYGTAAIVRRFGLTDQSLMAGLVQPLGKSRRWTATFEAAGSPRHQILPQLSFYGRLDRDFGKGWVGNAGLRHSRYSTGNVNLGTFGVEKYYRHYRAAYTLYVAHLSGGGNAASHLLQGNYYYGERNSVGAGVAFGEEIESVGPGQLIRTDVGDLNLNGRHWIDQKWGLSYVASWHRQGTLYTRSGAQLGLLYRF